MRHGIAENTPVGGTDSDRRLTSEGRTRLAAQLPWLKRQNWPFTGVASSPLARAQETARIVADGLGLPLEVEPGLGPGCSPDDLRALVFNHFGGRSILFVGHQPDLTIIAGSIGRNPVDFQPGSIAVIRTGDRSTGVIAAHCHPDAQISNGMG